MKRLFWIGYACAVFGAGFIFSAYCQSEAFAISGKALHLVRRIIVPKAMANPTFRLQTPVQRSTPPASLTLVGDSLTAYGPWNRLLKEEFNNFGIAGDTTIGVVERLAAMPLGDTVMLEVGTNDPNQGVPLHRTKANIEAIVAKLRGKRVLFAITPPMSDRDGNAALEPIRAYQREACHRMPRCTVVDLPAMLGDDSGLLRKELTDDGVHLLYPGYVIWANAIAS